MTYQYNNNINNNKNTKMYVRHTVVLVIDVLWYCNSIGFEKSCTEWNKAVRRICTGGYWVPS